ncbi:hypothetical protein [Nodosilinea sp. E11]|uniref:hypothetical protein n=1 Tax=Nodosilinea sp. E11 TaxID=3037479 RepID=UPI00293508EA|nr:hypothetical protein [Nodosilinea sp. E11]WOD38285.1 hypothetical protein RRF56_18910 [Nodosilinea sp. E11]
MAVKLLPLAVQRCGLSLGRVLLLGVAVGAIAACRPTPPANDLAPPPTAPTAPAPAPTSQPSAPAPTTPAPGQAGATLPDALVQAWQPLSNVLLAFGPMTIGPEQVQWGSGQTSPYTLISTEGGYLLQLEANPSFYDTQNRYIKLIPKADTNGASNSIEVAFYSDASQLQNDEYIMYGTYFAE